MLGWVRRQWGVRASPEALLVQLYVLDITLAGALGAVLLVSGERQFSGPAFTSAQDLVDWMPGEPHVTWGCLFIALAATLLGSLGRQESAVRVLRFGMVVYVFLAVACLSALVFRDADEAGSFICIASLIFATNHLVLSVHLDGYGWR